MVAYPATTFHKTFTTPFENYLPFIERVRRYVPRERLFVEFYSDGVPWLPYLVFMGARALKKSFLRTFVHAWRAARYFGRQTRHLGGLLRPDAVWMPGTTEQIRRVIHATATADIVLAVRKAGVVYPELPQIRGTAFPDLDLRDEEMLPVVAVSTDSVGEFDDRLAARFGHSSDDGPKRW